MQSKNNKSLFDSRLDLNQLYDCTRRSVISYFARNYADMMGYEPQDFEYVMLFVKKSYQAFYRELENAQKGN